MGDIIYSRSIKTLKIKGEEMFQQSEVFYTFTLVLLVLLVLGILLAFLIGIFLWIYSTLSYRKVMKPLNEEVERQRKEAEEKRKRMFSS